jgi:two-component system, sensor histidine kinase and response regulator
MSQRTKLLVIEDDKGISKVMQAIFHINEIDATFIDNGKSAIEALQTLTPDLILCDIMLPDIEGYEILKAAKSNVRTYTTPFIFLSAFADPKDVRKGMDLGADDYITKPFKSHELVNAIKARVQIKKERAELSNQQINESWLEVISTNFNHEFLTPLNNILNSIQLISATKQSIDAHQFDHIIKDISNAGTRMMRNTRKLIYYSIIKTNGLTLNTSKTEMCLSSLINETTATIQMLNPHNPISAQIADNITCTANYEHLRFIICELSENAALHSKKGGTVNINLKKEDNYTIFDISNEPQLVPRIDMHNIQPFRKYHEDKSMRGLGLGLYICCQLAQKNSYEITTKSTDTSITFSMKIPC